MKSEKRSTWQVVQGLIIVLALSILPGVGSLHAQESSKQILVLHKDASGYVGYANKDGKVVIPCKYETAMDFDGDLAFVRLDKKWGMINKAGKTVIRHKYEMLGLAIRDGALSVFTEGLARAQLNGKWGYLDKSGREVIPCIYDNVETFKDGVAQVKLNGETFTIDKAGKRLE